MNCQHDNVSRKRFEIAKQGKQKHWNDSTKSIQTHEFRNVEKGQSTRWMANDCLEFSKVIPWIYHDIDEIFKEKTKIQMMLNTRLNSLANSIC